jgi:hypothetical protein
LRSKVPPDRLFTELGDHIGAAGTHVNVAGILDRTDRRRQALTHAEQAYALRLVTVASDRARRRPGNRPTERPAVPGRLPCGPVSPVAAAGGGRACSALVGNSPTGAGSD